MNKKFIGISARALMVVVKPTALLFAVQLDSDGGARLAQIYLFGMLILSLMGTNAHRSFYKTCFDEQHQAKAFKVAREFRNYLNDISHQIFCIIILFHFSYFLFPEAFFEFLYLGLIFALAEKISDEGIRYAQFRIDNLRLMFWALAKISAMTLAILLAIMTDFDISLNFPIILFFFAILSIKSEFFLLIKSLQYSLRSGVVYILKWAFELLMRDYRQIAWVFTTIAIMNTDKWIVQLIEANSLPEYMLIAQVASIFLVIQTTFILAPSRVKLVNQNPDKIRVIQIYSNLVAVAAIGSGFLILIIDTYKANQSLNHFPFFLVGLSVVSAPYLERLYWIAPKHIGVLIDLFFMGFFTSIVLANYFLFRHWYSVTYILVSLIILLILRYICIKIFVTYYSSR